MKTTLCALCLAIIVNISQAQISGNIYFKDGSVTHFKDIVRPFGQCGTMFAGGTNFVVGKKPAWYINYENTWRMVTLDHIRQIRFNRVTEDLGSCFSMSVTVTMKNGTEIQYTIESLVAGFIASIYDKLTDGTIEQDFAIVVPNSKPPQQLIDKIVFE